MKTINLIVNYFSELIIEATGGTAQIDEPVDSDIILEEEKKIEPLGGSSVEESSMSDTANDTEQDAEENLELVSKDEDVNVDVEEENKEK